MAKEQYLDYVGLTTYDAEIKSHIDDIAKKYDRELVKDVVRRTYKAQFKRKQACLGIRLTERSFLKGINLPIVQKLYK